jgi:hypothetical protein
MSIIGLVGFAGSGKGAVADILVEKHGYTKLAFADSVKDATAVIFGWERALLEGDTDESREFREKSDSFWSARLGYDLTPRLALQKMGTEAGRDVFGKDLWITSVEKKILEHEKVVLADTRFPNEIEFIRKLYGHVIRVSRGPEPEWWDTALIANSSKKYLLSMETHFPKVHLSEWAWIGTHFDYLLDNNGSIHELNANTDYMLTLLQGPVKLSA